ncbi:lipopolysaccharide biosynthesis protein [Aurantimonas sp. A2-1-M11]|uniref:lipopolysaccharide biosynthesis protein n=1 Tax=Aurantimonas sp. A2-1-M11 TaxID=3113712 RepID=UPI002F91C3E4
MSANVRSLFNFAGLHAVSATVFVGLLVQVARPLISLLTLPLLLSQIGQGGVGVWMIALSLMGLVGFLSSGLSISLVTLVGRAVAESSDKNLHRLVSAGALIAVLWALLVLAIIAPVSLLIDWAALLNVQDADLGQEVRLLVPVLVPLLSFGIVASVPRQVMIGRMHGYFAYMLELAGLMFGAACLCVGILFDAPLWLLAIVFLTPPNLTMFSGGVVYLWRAGIPVISRRNLHRKTVRLLMADSLRMAGYQSAYAISSQSDLLLIGVLLGAPASAAYGVAQRVFSLPVLMAATVNQAQWPAMARADAVGDHAQVVRMFGYTLAIGSGSATVLAVIAAVWYQPLVEFWLGQGLDTDPLIIVGMVAWVLVATLVSTCDSLLRARHETNFLMRSMVLMCILNVATTLILLPKIGPSGAIFGSVTGFTVALLIPYLFRLRRDFCSSA